MTKQKILQDHKRRGKIFIPPFTHMLGPMHEISWVKTMIPEFLWIALIQFYHGLHTGVERITSLARITRNCLPSEKRRIFATISSFQELTNDEQSCLKSELAATGELFEIQTALLPLITFYPECPLRFLYSSKTIFGEGSVENIKQFRTLIEGLYNKRSKDAMMVQATAIWLAFDSGILKVVKGLTLASFPEIEKYPDTELSRKVGASIRASMHMFFLEQYYPPSPNWPIYFWNRGLEIDRCYFMENLDE